MKKKYIIIATSLLVLGSILFGGAMTVLKWNFKSLSTKKYQNSVHAVTDSFQDIDIRAVNADVILRPATDDTDTVTCFEEKRLPYTVSVADGVLRIEPSDNRKWYDYIGIDFHSPSIPISLPKGDYGALTASLSTGGISLPEGFSFGETAISASTGQVTLDGTKTDALAISVSTGKISLSGVTAGDTRISVSTGKVSLSDCRLASLDTKGATGYIFMKNTLIDGKLSIKRSTGDVEMEACDAGEIYIKTSTGDVTGSLLSDKIVFADANTGKVDIPQSTSGGKCEIETDTGDIKIKLVPKE